MSERKKEIDEKIKEEMEEIKQDKSLELMDIFKDVVQPEDTPEKDKIIEILFEHDDIRKITDISYNQMIDTTVLLTFAQAMKDKKIDASLIETFAENFLNLALSKGRKSREEIVEIYKTDVIGDMGFIPSEQSQRGRFQRLKERLF